VDEGEKLASIGFYLKLTPMTDVRPLPDVIKRM